MDRTTTEKPVAYETTVANKDDVLSLFDEYLQHLLEFRFIEFAVTSGDNTLHVYLNTTFPFETNEEHPLTSVVVNGPMQHWSWKELSHDLDDCFPSASVWTHATGPDDFARFARSALKNWLRSSLHNREDGQYLYGAVCGFSQELVVSCGPTYGAALQQEVQQGALSNLRWRLEP